MLKDRPRKIARGDKPLPRHLVENVGYAGVLLSVTELKQPG